MLWAANLCYKDSADPVRVGVWPGNREHQGLIISDVAELQIVFALEGWAKDLVNACAVEIPPNAVGQEWRNRNLELWNDSDGILSSSNADDLRYVALRGSHSTASIRNIKLGAKCDDAWVSHNGHLATESILEQNPSLREPVKAIPYAYTNRYSNGTIY